MSRGRRARPAFIYAVVERITSDGRLRSLAEVVSFVRSDGVRCGRNVSMGDQEERQRVTTGLAWQCAARY